MSSISTQIPINLAGGQGSNTDFQKSAPASTKIQQPTQGSLSFDTSELALKEVGDSIEISQEAVTKIEQAYNSTVITPDGAVHVRRTIKEDGITKEVTYAPEITSTSYSTSVRKAA